MFTFKKQPRATGLASIASPYASIDIKMNKKCVGWIQAPTAFNDGTWRIHFHVKIEGPGTFKNITLNKVNQTEEEARTWLNENFQAITKKYDLYENE